MIVYTLICISFILHPLYSINSNGFSPQSDSTIPPLSVSSDTALQSMLPTELQQHIKHPYGAIYTVVLCRVSFSRNSRSIHSCETEGDDQESGEKWELRKFLFCPLVDVRWRCDLGMKSSGKKPASRRLWWHIKRRLDAGCTSYVNALDKAQHLYGNTGGTEGDHGIEGLGVG